MNKTYTKTYTETENKLKIYYDDDPQSPREYDDFKMGYFVTQQKRCHSPDKNDYLDSVITKTLDNDPKNLECHIKSMTRKIKSDNVIENLKFILPVDKYDHGNVRYSLETNIKGWDSGICGFYFVFKNEYNEKSTKKEIIENVKEELIIYTQWSNGDVFRFELYDDEGEKIDYNSCFYDIEYIRSELPKEYQDDNLYDYLTER